MLHLCTMVMIGSGLRLTRFLLGENTPQCRPTPSSCDGPGRVLTGRDGLEALVRSRGRSPFRPVEGGHAA